MPCTTGLPTSPPQAASCTLVKPEVTSFSRKPPVPEAHFSPNERREKGVRCMELCITFRSLLPSRPKPGESRPRPEPWIQTPHALPDLLHALPLRRPSSATQGYRRNPPARPRPTPACSALPPRHPPRRRLPLPTPARPGSRFRPRVRACAPAAAPAAARGSLRRET